MRTRRGFLKNTGGLIAICCYSGIAPFLNSCINIVYVQFSKLKNKLVIKKVDMAENQYVLLNLDNVKAPIYLTKLSDQKFSALYLLCTHKGCEVRPAGDILICPCHGSEFSNTGKVLKSPAERNLASYLVTSDNENIYIHLNKR